MLLISHDDLDGFGSNVILQVAGIKHKSINTPISELRDKLFEVMNSDFIPKQIIMTDLSLPDSMVDIFMTWVNENDIQFTMLDHHKTALHLNKYDWAKVVPDTECGTSLLYKHINYTDNKCLESYIELVKSYDLWELPKNETAHDLNMLFQDYDDELDFVNEVSSIIINSPTESFDFNNSMARRITQLQTAKTNYITNKLKQCKVTDSSKIIPEYSKLISIGVIIANQHVSELGNTMVDILDIDVALIYNTDRGSVSLRSKGNTDVSVIARLYGGGGHQNASGFSPNRGMLKRIGEII